MSGRTLAISIVCTLVVSVAAVAYSWTVGPHADLVAVADDVLPGDSLSVDHRNLTPWCWTGACPAVRARSTSSDGAWVVEQTITRSLGVRAYVLRRDDTWLVGEGPAHTVRVRISSEPDGSSSLEWSVVGR